MYKIFNLICAISCHNVYKNLKSFCIRVDLSSSIVYLLLLYVFDGLYSVTRYKMLAFQIYYLFLNVLNLPLSSS